MTDRLCDEPHRAVDQAKLHAARMPAAKTLLVPPGIDLDRLRRQTDEIVEWDVAAAPIAVRVERGRMTVVVRQILTNHQRLARAVGDRRNLDGPLKRLPEENSPAAQVVVT